MRRRGEKLPPEEIRKGGKRGWLSLGRMAAGQPVRTAKFTGQNGGDIFPEMTSAQVSTISAGLVVTGFVQRGAEYERQAWYCVPVEAPEGAQPPDGRPRDGRRG